MIASSSWFTATCLGAVPGTITAANGKRWGFCRIRVDYREGGFEIATVPLWLAGMLRMGRKVAGKDGLISTASWAWHRFWKRGRSEGWIQIDGGMETAGDVLARDLREKAA